MPDRAKDDFAVSNEARRLILKYVLSCSFGKDSLAAAICRMERGEPVDEAVYCRVTFDNDTSGELPEHEEWIHNRAIPLLEKRYGIKTAVVQSERTYTDCFYSRYQKGEKTGRIYGFPFRMGPWCNDRLKVIPIRKWQKRNGAHVSIIGIAADEVKRIERNTAPDKILPLVDYGVTEAVAFDICKKAELLSPAYNNGRARLGCWFCHNQRVSELRRLRAEYPLLWVKLMELDSKSPVTFKPGKTLGEYDARFQSETN
jgi:3'-phosphoadenosine 5'-phosphosulfate sulfotransferase (PAPS reductase)/FAD synthetase